VLGALGLAGGGGVADSFGDLALDEAGFTLLFESCWVFRGTDPRARHPGAAARVGPLRLGAALPRRYC